VSDRALEIGTQNYTKVICLDELGPGGACHKYQVEPVNRIPEHQDDMFARVSFQDGPVKENGVNGCQNEDLLAIVIDRLRHFQAGKYACKEYADALFECDSALFILESR